MQPLTKAVYQEEFNLLVEGKRNYVSLFSTYNSALKASEGDAILVRELDDNRQYTGRYISGFITDINRGEYGDELRPFHVLVSMKDMQVFDMFGGEE